MDNIPLKIMEPTGFDDTIAQETLDELSNGKGDDEDE